jgi:hypothetical protein
MVGLTAKHSCYGLAATVSRPKTNLKGLGGVHVQGLR